jgi:hypothetical protein
MNVCEKDMQAKVLALVRWFASQDISTMDCAYMCAVLAGWAGAESLDFDRPRVRKGLKILIDAMQDSAQQACDEKNDC